MKHHLAAGSAAPEFEYRRQDGSLADFSDLWSKGPAFVIWPRHCG